MWMLRGAIWGVRWMLLGRIGRMKKHCKTNEKSTFVHRGWYWGSLKGPWAEPKANVGAHGISTVVHSSLNTPY